LRIFPLYYLALLLPLLMEPYFHWKLHPALWLWPAYLGNYARFIWPGGFHGANTAFEVLRSIGNASPPVTWNLDHFWSLCVEEQFYLVWPMVVFSLRDRVRLRNLCLAIVFAVPLLRWLCLMALPSRLIDIGFIYSVTPLRADSLMFGGAVALALRGPEALRVRAFVKPAAWALGTIFVLWQAASRLSFGHLIDPVWSSLHNPLFATFNAFFAGALILGSIEPGRGLYRFLNARTMRAVGRRSYGFYVYHLMLYSIFRITAIKLTLGHKGIAAAALPLIALVGTLLVSWVSFRYFEAPLLRLKKKWAP
jgi:peptidoglycan/LPS O-acetylase OafA/YrhL